MFSRLVLTFLTAFAVLSQPVVAQPSGAEGEDFIYRVQAGDTLSDLAELYTINNANWRTLQTLNNIADPLALPIGKNLRIPFSMIPMRAAPAVVTHRVGQPLINNSPAQLGDELQEGDVINTDQQSFLTLMLTDESTISIPPDSHVTLQRIQAFERARISDSILLLETGNIETRVAPNKQGVGRFEVHTPIAITGVRGTDLRVSAYDDKTITEVLTGQAKLHAPGQRSQMVPTNRGAAIDHSGAIFASGTLLPAPAISEPTRGRSGWEIHYPPLSGAQHYLVQVSLDEVGSQLVSRQFTTDTTAHFRGVGSGTHYVRVRAIDENGIMGRDAIASFPGHPVLQSSNGAPVMTRFNIPVTLNDF